MQEIDSYIDRNIFYEKVGDVVNEYINSSESYPKNSSLAINIETFDLLICEDLIINGNWEFYPISSLLRANEEGVEIDIDKAFDIANTYFFVR